MNGKRYEGFQRLIPRERVSFKHRIVMIVVKGEPEFWETDGTQAALELLLSTYRESYSEKRYIPYQVFQAETVQKLVNPDAPPPKRKS